MKILFCTPTFRSITHGPAKFANLLLEVNELSVAHELRILTEEIEDSNVTGVYKVRMTIPRPFHALQNFVRMLVYYWAARRIYVEYPFDVIVFNNAIHGYLTTLLMPANRKVVGLINDDENLELKKRYLSFSRKWIIKRVHRYFEEAMTRKASQVITCSNYLKRELIQEYKLPKEKVAVLYQGVKLADIPFRGERALRKGEQLRILFVKADIQIGGLDLLIKALTTLKNKQFELRVAGPLPKMERAIRRTIEEAGEIAGYSNIKLVFLGPLSQQEVFTEMYTCDVLCIPSVREGLGVANIEGLASGIPVVSTRVGGIPEVLAGGENGWLATPGDRQSLVACLLECLESPDRRRKKAGKGRAFIEAHFDHRDMLKRFVELLKKKRLKERED